MTQKAVARNLMVLVLLIGLGCQAFSQDSIYYVGSVGGSDLGTECGGISDGFRKGVVFGKNGLPAIRRTAVINRNEPHANIRVGEGTYFHFFGNYFEVLEIQPPRTRPDHVGEIICRQLPGKPEKGHIINRPRKGEIVPVCDDVD